MLHYVCLFFRGMDVAAGQLHALLDDPPWPEGRGFCLIVLVYLSGIYFRHYT